MHNAQTVKV